MSKVCKVCGCINENDNAKFCNDCGNKFEEEPSGMIFKQIAKSTSAPKLNQAVETTNDDDDDDDDYTELQSKKEMSQIMDQIDDDDDDYGENNDYTEESSSPEENKMIDDDDDADYEDEIYEESDVTEETDSSEKNKENNNLKKKIFASPRREKDVPVETLDEVTNDPYYNDVLPEINNERIAIQKDVVIKLIAASLTMVLMIFIMIYILS